MSRINDIIDLTQDTNDFYLVNPARNVRSVYIQLDNLCELTMKSFLQIETVKRQKLFAEALRMANLATSGGHRNALRRFFDGELAQAGLQQALGANNGANEVTFNTIFANHHDLQHWSAVDGESRKTFEDVLDEIKGLKPIEVDGTNNNLHTVLDRFFDRHMNRNSFFHDQNKAGLYPKDEECLEAFIDLFWLCSYLFEDEYNQRVVANEVIRSQIAVIKLKHLAIQKRIVFEIYQDVLRNRGTIELNNNSLGHEFCVLHEDAGNFFLNLQRHIQNLINQTETEVNRIQGLKIINASNREKVERGIAIITLYRSILTDCLNI